MTRCFHGLDWQNNADKNSDSQMVWKSENHIQQIVPNQEASAPVQEKQDRQH